MSQSNSCSSCGAPLQGAEKCPKCLLDMAYAPESELFTHFPDEDLDLPTREEIGKVLKGYTIGEAIGRGGMGVVFAAHDTRLDRAVAVKVLTRSLGNKADFARRFLREAQALARLNHPNIVTVHDYGNEGELYYLVMELVEGVDLRRLLADGKLKSAEAMTFVPQICDALQYAHEQGVVHRDIKPENILVRPDGLVKIADFGLAKMAGREANVRLTESRVVMGTPHYMAPEQVERPRDVDHRADIYALGVVFYEMLTGELPIGRFPLPSTKVRLDVRIDEVVLRSLEKEPDRRYQKASEVGDRLGQIQATPEPARPEEAEKARGFSTWHVVVLTGLTLVFGWRVFGNRQEPDESPRLSDLKVISKMSIQEAIAEGGVEDVEGILDSDAPIITMNGRNLLIQAADRGDIDILEILVARFPKLLNQPDSEGNTALTTAIEKRWEDGVRHLLFHGADPEIEGPGGQTPLMLAAISGAPGILKRVLSEVSKGGLHVRDRYNENAVHKAARMGHDIAVRMLIAKDASFNFLNKYDETALDLAVSRGHESTIEVLIGAGAQPTVSALWRQAVVGGAELRLGSIQRSLDVQKVSKCERLSIRHGVTSTTSNEPDIALRILALEVLMTDARSNTDEIRRIKEELAAAWPEGQPSRTLWESRILEGAVTWRKISVSRRKVMEWSAGPLEVIDASSAGTQPRTGLWKLL